MDKKILLVDDAAFMRMLIKDALTKNGYTNILEAADGAIACDVYAAEKPDLVIMDITMPTRPVSRLSRTLREWTRWLRSLCALQWVRKLWLSRL